MNCIALNSVFFGLNSDIYCIEWPACIKWWHALHLIVNSIDEHWSDQYYSGKCWWAINVTCIAVNSVDEHWKWPELQWIVKCWSLLLWQATSVFYCWKSALVGKSPWRRKLWRKCRTDLTCHPGGRQPGSKHPGATSSLGVNILGLQAA